MTKRKTIFFALGALLGSVFLTTALEAKPLKSFFEEKGKSIRSFAQRFVSAKKAPKSLFNPASDDFDAYHFPQSNNPQRTLPPLVELPINPAATPKKSPKTKPVSIPGSPFFDVKGSLNFPEDGLLLPVLQKRISVDSDSLFEQGSRSPSLSEIQEGKISLGSFRPTTPEPQLEISTAPVALPNEWFDDDWESTLSLSTDSGFHTEEGAPSLADTQSLWSTASQPSELSTFAKVTSDIRAADQKFLCMATGITPSPAEILIELLTTNREIQRKTAPHHSVNAANVSFIPGPIKNLVRLSQETPKAAELITAPSTRGNPPPVAGKPLWLKAGHKAHTRRKNPQRIGSSTIRVDEDTQKTTPLKTLYRSTHKPTAV